MNQSKPQSTRKHSPRLLWLVLLGSALAVVVLSTTLLSEESKAQLSSDPISSSASYHSPLAAFQSEPYDVAVTIDDMDPNPVVTGQPVTITASVIADPPGIGTPAGLLVIQAGQSQRCQLMLDSSGAGSCTLRFPLGGLIPLKAIYPGHSPFLPGVSDLAYLSVENPEWTTIVYQHDFETPVGDEWCESKQGITPSGRGFLGDFGSNTTCLSLASLPLHQKVSVSFDLYIIRSWNGNDDSLGPDRWMIEADSALLMLTTFSNRLGIPQAFPGQYPGQDYPRFTGAAEKFTLGYGTDSVYRLTFTIAHTQATLDLDFTASGLQEISNESWGLDNIIVRCIIPATNSSGEE